RPLLVLAIAELEQLDVAVGQRTEVDPQAERRAQAPRVLPPQLLDLETWVTVSFGTEQQDRMERALDGAPFFALDRLVERRQEVGQTEPAFVGDGFGGRLLAPALALWHERL